MHAGDNDDDVGVDAVEDSIGEPTKQRASCTSMNYWIHGRMSSDTFAGCLNGIQKLIPQAQDAAAHTKETRLQYRLPPQGGQGWVSRLVATNAVKHIFPGNAAGASLMQFVEPPIQFLTLGSCQGDRLGRRRETLPELFQELQTFF